VTAVAAPTRNLYVIQHTDGEFLGRMEDHLEGRGIRFTYMRPHAGGKLPASVRFADGLVLLGGGPWGSAGGRDLPSLRPEVNLATEALARGIPVIGIGLGAQILAIAGGGGSEPADLLFRVDQARRVADGALNGYLPERYPLVVYMRDRPLPPDYATVLAEDAAGRPALFQIGDIGFGFTGHPGAKRAMIEDLVMEFEEAPEIGDLAAMTPLQPALDDALARIMTGLVQVTGLMREKQTG